MTRRGVDYDAIAGGYDRRYRGQSYPGIEQALLATLRGPRGLSVLEVGCGTGHWLKVLAAGTETLVGIDPSAGMLERAREALPGALLVQGRAETLPCASSRFDRVLCVNAFHHFDDKDAFLAEARRVTRPEGGLTIIGLDPHAGRDSWWVYDYFHEVLALDRARYPSTQEIRSAMERAGFLSPETAEVQRIVAQRSADDVLDRGEIDRSVTSQLMILSESEYRDGRDRVRSAIEAAAERGEQIMFRMDVRIYATTAWVR